MTGDTVITGESLRASRSDNQNKTGWPDRLKAGIENLSGYSMDDVRVHYNSEKPAQLQAHAYTQGTDIHVGPGQEKHLAHEAWHVVQQKQGRVIANKQSKGGLDVNDDPILEKEADVMGKRASKSPSENPIDGSEKRNCGTRRDLGGRKGNEEKNRRGQSSYGVIQGEFYEMVWDESTEAWTYEKRSGMYEYLKNYYYDPVLDENGQQILIDDLGVWKSLKTRVKRVLGLLPEIEAMVDNIRQQQRLINALRLRYDNNGNDDNNEDLDRLTEDGSFLTVESRDERETTVVVSREIVEALADPTPVSRLWAHIIPILAITTMFAMFGLYVLLNMDLIPPWVKILITVCAWLLAVYNVYRILRSQVLIMAAKAFLVIWQIFSLVGAGLYFLIEMLEGKGTIGGSILIANIPSAILIEYLWKRAEKALKENRVNRERASELDPADFDTISEITNTGDDISSTAFHTPRGGSISSAMSDG
ncbi:DUF4157 domain-containing protein [Moorena sp. SIO4G3]|uniref:eCIS core domain-containing protein n=1 Tax=Moorena sp. SIO4G3 TaxID=2607821 RepID=UPI0025F925F7|nr:DUF4157 domain-containing protein [Moorena sp. SIO4G3]